jgi:nitrous oxidase accessory protein NosD
MIMARSRRSLLVVVGMVWLTLAAFTGSANAAPTVVGPGQSIQSAADAAKPGDTILVTGVHHENVAVTTDRLTLRGLGAVLEPAATPTPNACLDPTSPADVNGICVLGDVNFDTGEVNRPVNEVTVTGLTIRRTRTQSWSATRASTACSAC